MGRYESTMPLLFLLLFIAAVVASYALWRLARAKGPAFFIISILALILAVLFDLIANAGGQKGMIATPIVTVVVAIFAAIVAVTQGFVSLHASKLPRGLIWFAATAVVFILQVVPYPGIFLMFFGAPLWSILTINLGFAHIAAEAAVGRIHRAWMVLPVVWLAGYTALALQSHLALKKLDAELRADNAKNAITLATDRHTLVFSPSMADTAKKIVSDYNLDDAFARTASPNPAYIIYRMADKGICDRNHTPDNLWRREQLRSGQDLCVYRSDDGPKGETIIVGIEKREPERLAAISHSLSAVTIEEKSRTHTLVMGTAYALTWLPLPMIGCTLISSASKWQCSIDFWKTPTFIGGDGGTVGVVAAALGLQPRSK